MGPFYHHRVALSLSGPHRPMPDNPDLATCLFGTPSWSRNADPQHCYVLLEAARYFALAEELEASGLPYMCLFKGKAAEELAAVAPFLVQLHPDAPLLKNLLTGTDKTDPPWHMWGRGGAVFLRAGSELRDLARHFRHFTRLLDDATGRWNYFRFYAPEVMLSVIAHMDPAQFAKFSDGVDYFAVPDGTDGLTIIGDAAPAAPEQVAC